MPETSSRPLISAVIPTYNRAGLLAAALDSLEHQTLGREDFEVLVVDDGSTDDTPAVCRRFQSRFRLRYFRLRHAGIAAAKNAGLFAATGRILFFFDDDDVAHSDLLRQHVEAHRRWPDESAAVLGYTAWAPWLALTELMHYVTHVGQCLFSYPSVDSRRPLDFTYFWGGRSSCKRSFLARHGAFRQDFEFGCEDIELGYRLKRFGLTVRFEPQAISFMNRAITVDEFCRRCERQGRAQFVFSRIHHRDPLVQQYCDAAGAAERWRSLQPQLPDAMHRLKMYESDARPAGSLEGPLRRDLYQLYEFVFNACKVKGMVESAAERRQSALQAGQAARERGPAMVSRSGAPEISTAGMPVFVIGSPRSGTTTLAMALAQHSHLWTSGESYFLWDLFGEGRPVGREPPYRWMPAAAAVYEKATGVSSAGWLNRQKVGRQEFLAALGAGIHALFSRHSQGRRWIDHTPHHVLMADVLAEMFPDACFLHILRDGRSTVHSMLHFQNRAGASAGHVIPVWATDFQQACDVWRTSVMAALDFEAAFPGRCFTLRHDRFAADPDGILAEVFRFIRVPDEEGPSQFARTRRLNSSFPGRRVSGDIPASEWPRSRRELFCTIAGEAAVKAGLVTPGELEIWVEGTPEAAEAPQRNVAAPDAPVQRSVECV